MSLTFHLHGCRIIVAVQEKTVRQQVADANEIMDNFSHNRRHPLVSPSCLQARLKGVAPGMRNLWYPGKAAYYEGSFYEVFYPGPQGHRKAPCGLHGDINRVIVYNMYTLFAN